MIKIPAKAQERITKNMRKFQKIITSARSNDINEADTVSIIKDILSDVLGYDKYSEITAEYAIRRTFCDLAILQDGEPYLLLEAKAVGIELKDSHTKQALDYGSNKGIDWIILTNAAHWKIYKIVFSKPIQTELVYEFCFENLNPRKQADIEMLYYLSKEASTKSTAKGILDDLREHKQLLSRYLVGQILVTDDVAKVVRRILKSISPNVKVAIDEIKEVIESEVIKRDVFEDEKASENKRRVTKATAPRE